MILAGGDPERDAGALGHVGSAAEGRAAALLAVLAPPDGDEALGLLVSGVGVVDHLGVGAVRGGLPLPLDRLHLGRVALGVDAGGRGDALPG
jgi:hypothetical protein